MTLATISFAPGPVSSQPPPHVMVPGEPPMVLDYMMSPSLVASHSLDNAPPLDAIMVPGGIGLVALAQADDRRIEKFLAARAPSASYVLSVCTGATVLARAGLLAGKRATTNKAAWADATAEDTNTTWVPSARWVEDGKMWTSSGVAAGMDMAYAFLKNLYGVDAANKVANGMEYAPHTDPHWDPFSVVWKVSRLLQSRHVLLNVRLANIQAALTSSCRFPALLNQRLWQTVWLLRGINERQTSNTSSAQGCSLRQMTRDNASVFDVKYVDACSWHSINEATTTRWTWF